MDMTKEQLSGTDLKMLERQKTALKKKLTVETSNVDPPLLLKPSNSEPFQKNILTLGQKALQENKVAVITVAGGQASRLGFKGPKGAFPLGEKSGISLFQFMAEQVLEIRKKYSCRLPWIIQTGPDNHIETVNFFSNRNWFGMASDSIHFVCQGTLPALYPDGQLVLNGPNTIFRNPDGHGGVYRAIKDANMLQRLEEDGVEILYYCQVDNPLVFIADPIFIGHHLSNDAEMSVKVVEKTDPAEKVGLVVVQKDSIRCVEYSDIDESLQRKRSEDGGLLFRAGNIAIHAYSLSFFKEMAEAELPLHLACKKNKVFNAAKNHFEEAEIIKFETFVFDALPLASKAIVQLADRDLEFSPVKNRDGNDSIKTAREAIRSRATLLQEGMISEEPYKTFVRLSSSR